MGSTRLVSAVSTRANMVLHAWDARGHLWRTVGSKGAAGGREGEKVEEFTTWPSQLREGVGVSWGARSATGDAQDREEVECYQAICLWAQWVSWGGTRRVRTVVWKSPR